ncbi:glycoside hydrolase family 16 protein [Kitasatospora cineracea]|uniref:glycoside hydrolase family 16 protein n=1 Tax=Kitasatospora cineracea TaxID=88074 RepID=UPI0033C0D04D
MRPTPLATPARLGVLAGAAALVGVPLAAGPAGAATGTGTTVVQDRLAPAGMTAGSASTASLTLHANRCFTAKTVGVGIRDAAGANLDFPGSASNVRICSGGVTVTTGARTLPAGTYTQFGFWQDTAGGWHNLPSRTLTVAGATTAPTTPTPTAPTTPTTPTAPDPAPGQAPVPGKSLTWSEEFSGPIAWGSKWTGDRSSAYRYGSHNPDDNKLDWLAPSAVTVSGGVATFTATPSAHTLENGKQAWDTGLLTTEYSKDGFQVRTGDYIEARVKLPAGTGAWPALWTWKDGNNEIDSFEYHPDNPNLLELSNRIRSGLKYHTDANAVAPDRWVTIGTYYGADSVDWYVNGAKVFSDGTGVGANWSAYPILNLSLSAGQYHPAASGSAPVSFSADYLRVYR